MIVVADASVLVAELLRTRGRELLTHPDLRVVVAEEQWDETQHELQRRIGVIVKHALAAGGSRLVLDAAILTGDHDFLGCGCPTWTAETLRDGFGRS